MKTVAIVNPAAGRRQARRVWPRLLEAAGPQGSRVTTWWTAYPRHAESLAAQARREGYQRVVAVGGDGTLFEVANGLWREPGGALPSLGTVPLGTGCDYVRNFSPGAGLMEHLLAALSKRTVSVSAGVFLCASADANPGPRVFLNHLGVGFDAEVVAFRQRWRLPIRGKLPYFLAGLQALFDLMPYRLRGEIDGEPLDSAGLILVAGLGRSFGGGLHITPEASPRAPRFQVVWVGSMSRFGLLSLSAEILAGKPLRHPQVHAAHSGRILLATDPPAWIDVDGELAGQTPLAAEVLPKAFQMAIHGI